MEKLVFWVVADFDSRFGEDKDKERLQIKEKEEE